MLRVEESALEEMQRVGGEVLRDLAHHAKTRSIDMLLICGRNSRSLSIHDDGVRIREEIGARSLEHLHSPRRAARRKILP